MATIESALAYFLTNVSDGDTSQPARQTARQYVYDKVEDRVTIGRRPQGEPAPAITLTRSGVNRFNDLGGEPDHCQTVLEVTLWTKGELYPDELLDVADNIRQAITQYRGSMKSLRVHGLALESDFLLVVAQPTDGSDDWTFGYQGAFEILHETTPVVAIG